MKNLNIYIVILFLTAAASVWQMNLLGKGLFAQAKNINIAEEQVTPQATTPTHAVTQIEKGFVPTRIVMEQAGIDLQVVSVPLKNGTWEVFPHVANYAEGTGLVNDKTGNVGIYGHDRVDALHNMKQLLTGSDIIVLSNSYRAIYRVQTSTLVDPSDVSVFYPTKEPMLTLITCDGSLSEKRYLIRAKLVKIEKTK
jgi:LPXTG-site transpeptidase (sortase) family protein